MRILIRIQQLKLMRIRIQNPDGGKFATGVNGAGGKFPPVSTTPAVSLPPVSFTPVANNGSNYQTADNLK
jgi:hypothetical protein